MLPFQVQGLEGMGGHPQEPFLWLLGAEKTRGKKGQVCDTSSQARLGNRSVGVVGIRILWTGTAFLLGRGF